MRRLLVLGWLVLGVMVSRPAFAQVGASLSGTVSDSSGAVVPGAKVTITDTATGVAREVAATDAGFYTAADLQPGPYQVTVTATGFATLVRSGLNLTVGGQITLNLSLQVGQVSQQVEVTAEAPTVELSSSALSSQVLQGAIRELPLNGRDWTSLATLEPGVNSTASLQVSYTQSTTQRVSRGFGAQMSVAGANPYWNNFRVDGIVTNDYMNVVPGNALGVSLGVDAIEEFSVITNNYSAEYGRTAGGILNAITRSGTNQIHGTAFEFLRNSAFDARNFFDPETKPALRRNQFGGSVGGPIRKDKTFFFAAYEGLRNAYGSTTIATVPSPATNGTAFPGTAHFCTIPTGVTPNCTPSTVTINPAVLPYLGIWGQVNFGLLGNGDTGNYRFVANQNISANYGLVRFDHHFSSSDSLSGSFVDDTSYFTQPDGINFIVTPQATANKRIVLTETHILGAGTVNSLRLGYNRVNVYGAAVPCGPPTYHCAAGYVNPLANNPNLGVIAGFNAPAISPGSGITGDNGGLNDQGYDHEIWNSFQGYDDISLIKGKHSISLGAGFEHDQNARDGTLNLSGSFTYSTLQGFLTNGAPQSFLIWFLPYETPAGGESVKNWRVTVLGFYFQDSYRVRKNLTLNLGVRYEPQSVPSEANGRTASLTNLSDATVRLGNPVLLSNNSFANVAPRVGFAWDPFGTGKTSVRSAFGMFDVNLMPYEFGDSMQLMAPYSTWIRQNNPPAGLFPTAIIPEVQAYSGGQGTFAEFMQLRPQRSYMMQYNLSVQQQITPSLSLMLAYVGSAGVHQEESDYDVNYAAPVANTSAGWLFAKPIGSGIKPNPNPRIYSITQNDWLGHSNYNGMLAQVTQRLNRGFQVQGSFTWGKGMSNNNSASFPATFRNGLNEWLLFENNRARNDYDIKDNLVVSGSWTVPNPHFGSHAANVAIGGWTLQSIVSARTGVPFSVLINGDPLGTNTGTPVAFPQYNPGAAGCTPGGVNPGNPAHYINLNCFSVPMATSAISSQCVAFSSVPGSCANLVGNASRNLLTAPGLVNVDFSVIKNQQITERLNSQFRAEFFNLFNRANFNYPSNNTLFSGANGTPIGNAGQITSTSNFSRQIQFALKLIW